MLPAFVAIDFETADYHADSACSLALVRVERNEIVARQSRLIRPPRKQFRFTYLHGISWDDVAFEPEFADIWPELEPILDGASFLVAHNARFDQNVLNTCCRSAGWAPPPHPYLCSVRVARRAWRLPRYRLSDVCGHLGIALNHHVALSDAEAAARIVIAAAMTGETVWPC
jgi:DNA polymerase-3 subunit epsilon